ncbi:MAG: family 43 glycosylhydrolase [Pelomonas sp.]|nr:family 43 glycosylhydrolase [Roseateles sp.]
MTLPRRTWLKKTAALGSLGLAVGAETAAAAATAPRTHEAAACGPSPAQHGVGVEGQRRADRGDGSYLNPIVAGDHPDPTVLKDGADYYMTFSSFDAYPGAVIWHSTDLVNWAPIGAALHEPIGTVWAMDLVKHEGRYFIYIPVLQDGGTAIYAIHADAIAGPWSAPVNLGLPGCIDPGHVVGEDGARYLFGNGGRRVRLRADGLATAGPLDANAWTPWQYPADWEVEMFAPEGPKLFRRGAWFYLVSAVGGTSGPPTSHMVTLARSRSVHGPWEDCPHNPIVYTASAAEPWWSRGHASVVEGPGLEGEGGWWLVYHGYENGYRTLGRQTLLEPIRWTEDGWFRALGGTLDKPLPCPRCGRRSAAAPALSDDFSTPRLGTQWSFHAPGPRELERLRFEDRALVIAAKGTTLADGSPLLCSVGDHGYEASVELEMGGAAQGGLTLFYNERAFVGVGFSATQMFTYNYGQEHTWMRTPFAGPRVWLRVRNRANVVSFEYSSDGAHWIRHPWCMEVSGLHHNSFGGFVSLRVGVFSVGAGGGVRVRGFAYRAIDARESRVLDKASIDRT